MMYWASWKNYSMIEHYTKAFSSFGWSPSLITVGAIVLLIVYIYQGAIFPNKNIPKSNQDAQDYVRKRLKMNAAARKHTKQGYRQNNKN